MLAMLSTDVSYVQLSSCIVICLIEDHVLSCHYESRYFVV